MGPIQTFDEAFDLIRRRLWLIVLVAVIGAVGSVMYALSLPHQYASSEVIQIEQPQIAVELAQSPDESSAARRLQLIEQQLMARESVLAVIEKFGLFADMPALNDSEKVLLFRQSIRIEGIAAAREGGFDDGTIAALTITATLGAPDLAQTIAHELSQRTIELSSAARRAKAKATLDFFEAEESALAAAVSDIEAEISAIRSQNVGLIAGQAATHQSEVTTVNAAILQVESARIGAIRELELLDGNSTRARTQREVADLTQQIATFDEQLAFLNNRLTGLEQSVQNTPQAEGEINLLNRRLEQFQTQLSTISTRRTEAEISHRLEQNRQAERLTILEPASYPEYPIGPGRKKYALAGAIGALMLGLALAYLLDVVNPVVRSSNQLQRELGITAAVTIPVHAPKKRRRSNRLKSLLGWVSGKLRSASRRTPRKTIRTAL